MVIFLAVKKELLTAGFILVRGEKFKGKRKKKKKKKKKKNYPNKIFNGITNFTSGLPNVLQRSSASLVHHRNRRTMFICCVIVLMSAVSAIGLQLCPMATSDKCSNASVTTTDITGLTPAIQSSIDEKKADPDFQVNVYVSAIINHNNITINSDKSINIDMMSSVNNFTTNATGHSNVWHKLSKQFLRNLINESQQVFDDIEEQIPKNDYLMANISTKEAPRTEDTYADPCSHPEYIVFTWVSFTTQCYIAQDTLRSIDIMVICRFYVSSLLLRD